MYADDVIFFSPAAHELLDVSIVQRFVKCLLNIVWRTTHNGGLQFVSFHGVLFGVFTGNHPFCRV
jgi:hypothetical protein